MKKRKLALFAGCILILMIAGCGKAGGQEEKVQTVTVGTGTQFPNICFIQNGKLTGYDVELVREIDKRLPGYKFKFKTMEFSNLLTSLSARKIDMVAHEMETNPERKKRFLFNKVAYNYFPLQVTVLESNNTIKGLDDLDGKTVITSATSNAATLLDKINKERGNKFKIVYEGTGANETANQLKTGRADATVSTPFAVKFQNETSSIKEKVVGNVLSDSKVYFMFNKDNQKLSNEVDKALKEITKDGTLKKLSLKWLGADYSKSSF